MSRHRLTSSALTRTASPSRGVRSASMNHSAEAGERFKGAQHLFPRPMDILLTLPTFGLRRRPRRQVRGPASRSSRVPGFWLTSACRAAIIRREVRRRQMDEIETSTPESERSGWRLRLQQLRLGFRDPGTRVGLSRRPFQSRSRQHPLRLPGWDRPLGRVGPAPAPPHAGPVRSETRLAHAVRRVHPDVGRRPGADVSRGSSGASGNGCRSPSQRRPSCSGSSTSRASRRCPRSTDTSASS